MSPELSTSAEEKQIAEMIETDIDHALEQKHVHEADVCDICGHKVHALCNGAQCEEPHFDPQNPPEPPDYE